MKALTSSALALLAVLALAVAAPASGGTSCRPSSIGEPPNDSYRPGSPTSICRL